MAEEGERKRSFRALVGPDNMSEEMLDKCIELYLTTGSKSSIATYMGKTRKWAAALLEHPRVVERMKSYTVGLAGNPNVATIEECMTRLTAIMRGAQLQQLTKRVEKLAKTATSGSEIIDAIKGIARVTPQIESNQIKAVTMLLTAQGALDAKKSSKDNSDEILDDLVLALVKSRSVDTILNKLNVGKVIDVTPEFDAGREEES